MAVATLVGVVVWVLASSGVAVAAPVTNGGFESGSLGGWTVTDQPGSDGSWFAYSGVSAPKSGSVLPLPPEGAFAAVTDQLGHGTHALHQDLVVDPGLAVLQLRVFYVNQADHFTNGAGYDYTQGENQRFTVDVLRAGADPMTSDGADVIATILTTSPGDPLEVPAVVVSVDLSAHTGETVRLRAIEVDTLQFLNAGVDDVRFVSSATPPIDPAQPVPAAPAFTG